LSALPDWLWSHPAFYSVDINGLSPEMKQPIHEANCSPLSSAEVKNVLYFTPMV